MALMRIPAHPVPKDYIPPNSVPHKVKTGENWGVVAAKYGKTYEELVWANFKTLEPREINWYLHNNVGCKKVTRDGYNYMFSDNDNPGIIHIPPQVMHMPPMVITAKAPDKLLDSVWLGVGVQSGGRILFGIDSVAGPLFNLGDHLNRVRYAVIMQEGASIGLGLGGSGGLVAIFAYGIKHVSGFDSASVDFDFGISLGPKLGAYLKNLKHVKNLKNIGKVISKSAEYADEYKKLKYVGENMAKSGAFTKPGLFVLPVPGANWGLGLWAGYRASETKLEDRGTIDFTK
jgi:hypothetical protein